MVLSSWSADEEDEETWDALFKYSARDEGDYINPESPDEERYDVGPSDKGEVATQGNEDKDIEILEISEDRQPTNEGPIEEPVKEMAPEVPSPEIPPTTETNAAEPITTRDALVEITRDEAAYSEVVTITTSIPQGNDCNILI